MFPDPNQDTACICSNASRVTHVLVSDAGCGALCYTVEARHNMMVDAWCRVSAREGIYSSLDSHV